jgi:hypothetical protein
MSKFAIEADVDRCSCFLLLNVRFLEATKLFIEIIEPISITVNGTMVELNRSAQLSTVKYVGSADSQVAKDSDDDDDEKLVLFVSSLLSYVMMLL